MAGNDWVTLRRNELATDQILDAAEKLFTEHGPDAVGMNDIAADCRLLARDALPLLRQPRSVTNGLRAP